MLGYVYNGGSKYPSYHFLSFLINPISESALSTRADLGVKVATPVGTLVGQLLFGWLADVVGRKKMCRSLLPSLYLIFLISPQTVSSS